MEENHERLRGEPAGCTNRLKEDIFPDNDGFKHITTKKVKDKYSNMKKALRDAKTMQEQSGFGLDCEKSINGIVDQATAVLCHRDSYPLRDDGQRAPICHRDKSRARGISMQHGG